MAKTLFEKIWDRHVVHQETDRPAILYIDAHLVHEVTSAQAFEGLRIAGRKVRRPDLTHATADHNVPTSSRSLPIQDPIAKRQLDALEQNCKEFGITLYGLDSPEQGIIHVIGPELGITQPGMTIVCGDSHTSTHGGLRGPRFWNRDQRGRTRSGHPVLASSASPRPFAFRCEEGSLAA